MSTTGAGPPLAPATKDSEPVKGTKCKGHNLGKTQVECNEKRRGRGLRSPTQNSGGDPAKSYRGQMPSPTRNMRGIKLAEPKKGVTKVQKGPTR